ncbi:EutP/PduV family microcompartment system protein [Desulfosediminicola sp.]|uniref:EutP/PduV family microcompartment system protein n=1 Tax=Desulfosediminicola sp. TaxID=2886825 RepID=UPI003AF23050
MDTQNITRKVMLVGETLVGKSSLIRTLSAGDYSPRRAMAVEYHGRFINTPGEFLENRRFYNALITTSADCDVLLLVQDATRKNSLFPPLFASMFNRRVVGIISKIDDPAANRERAIAFLRNAGVKEFYATGIISGDGLDELRRALA